MDRHDAVHSSRTAEIIGYAQPWIVSPGDNVNIKISSTEPAYTYRTVRLIQGHDGHHFPVKKSELIHDIPSGNGEGKFQAARPGSYAIVNDWISVGPRERDGLQISLYFQPWLPQAGHDQVIISTHSVNSQTGFALILTIDGELHLWVGTGEGTEVITTGVYPCQRFWAKTDVKIWKRNVEIYVAPISFLVEKPPFSAVAIQKMLACSARVFRPSALLFGAGLSLTPYIASSQATNHFNGRIDNPIIQEIGPDAVILAQYDFARGLQSDRIYDISGFQRHGQLVNAPARAVRGYNWNGSELDWTKAKTGYGAIHFHDDDLDDAEWETDFSIIVPPNAQSGAYAVEVVSETTNVKDDVVFFVRPAQRTAGTDGPKVAIVLPSFTYLAYANERLYEESRLSFAKELRPSPEHEICKTEDWLRMERRTDLGLSCYDTHHDGSGTIFSSSKRPILNIRPSYMFWGLRRPREFSADLLMIGFLEELGIRYDVCYDHDLHSQGSTAITQYNIIITGSHPEYASIEILEAYTAYARGGGNIMYLGGNGFYWVASFDSHTERLEIRRGDQGLRSFTLLGGEWVHSHSGQQGGLWRSRGRAANHLFGVGSCGEGPGPGVPYQRTAASRDPALSWIFDGIEENELIGVQGFGGGASGDEIDRFDAGYGSPTSATIVATSIPHPPAFCLFPEDVSFPISSTRGGETDDIRSDMIIYRTNGGGYVFSVGSVNWFCSLAWNGYQNNVARLTKNVLYHFLEQETRTSENTFPEVSHHIP